MGEAIGQALPAAVGVALSPFPIIAVVLMLTTRRARTNGPAFIAGWLLGLGTVGTIVLLVAGPADASTAGQPATWVNWLKILLGLLLLRVAARQFQGRPHPGEDVRMPKWMGAVDRFTTSQSVFTGAVLAGANPKNTVLAVSAAATIAQTGIGAWQQAVAYTVFAVIGTIGVAAPVVLYLVMGKGSANLLVALRDWLERHSGAVMSVICLVIGVKLIGDAIGALT